MAARREDELELKKRRVETVNELIVKAERKVKRLVSAFGDSENADEIVRATVQAEVKATSTQRDALIAERETLEAELVQGAVDEATRAKIKASAAVIRQRLTNSTFEQRRELLDLLDVRARLREDEKGR